MKAQQVGEKEHTRAWMPIEEFVPSTVRNPKSFFYCFVLFFFFLMNPTLASMVGSFQL
jgi:hypothetical protein